MKKLVVSVTNDLVTDQRVKRSIEVLMELGFEPTFVGRMLPGSMPFEENYRHKRFRLPFRKGFLFYASYNLRLFFFLLFRRYDVYLSNDLDTLLPNYLISRLYSKPLIYDSHEYFTGVPEIQHRPFVKGVWTALERMIFPKIKDVITVNDSIADLYEQEYHKRPMVVRNISDSRLPSPVKSRAELDLPQDAFILINQGSGINVDRGMEEMLEALTLLPDNVILLIVGNGDVLDSLKDRASQLKLQNRVKFVPRRPYLQMLQYTVNADCGLSLDKSDNLNYRFSLPNKVFDYIKSGIPMVTSSVVEVKSIVERYNVGEITEDHKPDSIAAAVMKVYEKGKSHYRENLGRAGLENNWELERQKLKTLFERYS